MKKLLKSRFAMIAVFLVIWELIAYSEVFPRLLFPDISSVFRALYTDLFSGQLMLATGYSLYLIFYGLFLGIVAALVLSILAMISSTFADGLETVVAVLHPLPGIALLPLFILWFGIGDHAIIIVIMHATIWPMIINTLAGFRAVPKSYIEIGENIGLSGINLVLQVMTPSAVPYLITGCKIGWARAWRALIAAEMIFGSSGSMGGLGWYIYQKRFMMDVSGVFAALIVIIIIGLVVEEYLFNILEKKTITRWGLRQGAVS